MRLFFALWPDEAVRAQLAHWARELHAVCGGRPTRPENLHVTLAFLGNVEDARVAEVERAASEVTPCSTSLVAELRSALARSRIAFDSKGFVSHVTLLRDAREPREMPALDPIEWRLDGFALVRSVALPQGSRYEIRNSWKGRAAP